MSVLVVGLSHRSAPLALLERAALAADAAGQLAATLARHDEIVGALVLATCNRLEVYAGAASFHGALSAVTQALTAATGIPRAELIEHLYVHYEDRAIAHVFEVTTGLDSMALGESQILGQMRDALRVAQRTGALSPALRELINHALRVGKKAHAETDLDAVSRSLVGSGLDAAAEWVGPLADRSVLVVGVGGMGALAATAAAGVAGELVVVNRTAARAFRLAERLGARAVTWARLGQAVATADVVIASTGATEVVLTADTVCRALADRSGRRLAFVDLALPRDVDPAVAQLPGVAVIDLQVLGQRLAGADPAALPALGQVRDLVTAEVAEHLTSRAMRGAAPAVAALRARAGQVVAAELARLDRKLPDLDDPTRAALAQTVNRIVDKLLHTPTVRAKTFAALGDRQDGEHYAAALRELFDLDPHDVATLSRPPFLPGEGGPE